MVGVQGVVDLFQPWNDLYSNSVPLSTAIVTLHIVSLLIGGGLAIGADRTTLRVSRLSDSRRHDQLGELRAIHRPVLIALTFLVLSGLGMATADLENFLGSPYFWIKLGLVFVLAINGGVLLKTEQQLKKINDELSSPQGVALWARLRMVSKNSIVLWTLTAIAGVVLANAS